MTTILAIDPAWTNRNPSGIAVVRGSERAWECVALAPSYDSFFGIAEGQGVDWLDGRFRGARPDPSRLIDAAKFLAGVDRVDLVVVDMPVATVLIKGRREADRTVSRTFGSKGCSTHSPNSSRPGAVGTAISGGFGKLGYSIATTKTPGGDSPCLVETYPHPALLFLLGERFRVKYKVAKSRKYWPSATLGQRKRELLRTFGRILDALRGMIANIPLSLPAPKDVPYLSRLKSTEDALDALVCAWVGIEYARGNAVAHGDRTAAIWLPGERAL